MIGYGRFVFDSCFVVWFSVSFLPCSVAIIFLQQTRGLLLYFNCVVAVSIPYLFLMVPWVGLWSVIVEFPGHTHLKNEPRNVISNNVAFLRV